MIFSKILSPWRGKSYDHYTSYTRVSLDNVIRGECFRSINDFNCFWITNMNNRDKELIADGYKLCSSEEEFQKYKILM